MTMSTRERALSGVLLVLFVLLTAPHEAWLLGVAALLAPFVSAPQRSRTFAVVVIGVMLLVTLSGDPVPLGAFGVLLLVDALRSSSLSAHGVRWRRGRASG
jgi:hypothetical protein